MRGASIRLASQSDVASIIELATDLFPSDTVDESGFDKSLSEETEAFFPALVAYDGERFVGYALARPYQIPINGILYESATTLELRQIGVLPGARGRGIGRLLLDALEAHAREKFGQIVARTDSSALEFYNAIPWSATQEPGAGRAWAERVLTVDEALRDERRRSAFILPYDGDDDYPFVTWRVLNPSQVFGVTARSGHPVSAVVKRMDAADRPAWLSRAIQDMFRSWQASGAR